MPRPQRSKPEYQLTRIDGRRNWYVRYSEPGSRRSQVKSTGVPLADRVAAEEWVAALKAADEAIPEGATIAEIVDRYLEDKKGVRTIVKMKSFAKPLKAYMGDRTPDQITKSLLAGYLPHRKKMVPAVRQELGLLIQALNHADRQPGEKITLPAAKPPREHFATREQAQALLQAATEHTRLYLLIAMATGARMGAILDLTWDRVDEDRGILDFNNPDIQVSKKRRAVTPISKELVAALRDQRERKVADTVVEYGGKPVANITKSFGQAVKNAKLPKWLTPHVLKHSVISWLAEDGWTVDQISDFTCTHPNTVRRVYRKVNPETLRGMADSLSFGSLVPTVSALTKNKKKPKTRRNLGGR